ncbi:MAG: cytochrome c [Bryobacteraceae bacterium]
MTTRTRTVVALVAVAILLLVIAHFFRRFTRDVAVVYSDPVEHFKYGSTGGEIQTGIPYSVWMTLPRIFGLPGGNYQSFGFLYEDGRDLPIGVSKRNYQGIDRVSFNCAICHYGSVRDAAASPPRRIAAMPSNTVDLRAFYNFLFEAAKNDKFSAGLVLSEGQKMGIKEDFINRQILRFYAVIAMRTFLLDFSYRLKFIMDEPEFGPGRIDTFSPAKALMSFQTSIEKMPKEERIGTTDLPSVWYQGKREGMQLHWDGNNTDVRERDRSAAFGTGAYPATLDRASMARVEDWLINTAAPLPFPYPIDATKSVRGKVIYDQLCEHCHGPDGKNFTPGQKELGKVTPIDEIKTDRHRLDSYTRELAVNQNLLYAETKNPEERFSHFRKTYGYANMPLDGVWLRAPYLHNGSVPTLRDLLEPGANRPPKFYRGDDVFDPVRVGFESNVPARNGQNYFPYDTKVEGNFNTGHEGKYYGTELPPADKDALVEYLKTF